MFEEVFGWSPVKSGAVVLLIFVGNIGVKPATTYLYSRFGFRSVIITATAGMAMMMLAMAGTTATTPVAVIGLILLLSGMARSVGATGYMTMAFGDVPPAQMRDASTLQTTVQQLAAGFGVTGAAIALRVGHAVSSSTETQFRIAFVLVALLALTATAAATRFSRHDGNVLRTPSKALAADVSAGS
jgi:MFS family permease